MPLFLRPTLTPSGLRSPHGDDLKRYAPRQANREFTMQIKWKQGPRFKPVVILKQIDSVRTINPEGGASFAGFDLENCLPALHSMLEFPAAAADMDASTLVWSGLKNVGQELTPDSFLAAVNKELADRLATTEQTYFLLTALSLHSRDVPRRIQILGAELRIFAGKYASRFNSREALLIRHPVRVPSTPAHYCKVVVKVKAKSPSAAINRAFRALDLQRGLWCLMGNPRMQLAFGSPATAPINVIRLGSQHTLHLSSGKSAMDGIWFEPGFYEASSPFRISKPDVVSKNSRWALRQISASPYSDRLISSLTRFARAFDESDPNTAFLRLWSALETLTTPGQADYNKVVQRCSFLFKERALHGQLLEHLREYRNANVHAGEESDRARTHCFQLQLYFVNLIWFHVQNARYFRSLEEANFFLDSPADKGSLKRHLQLRRKAVRFRA
jgi:hypothetical protein